MLLFDAVPVCLIQAPSLVRTEMITYPSHL